MIDVSKCDITRYPAEILAQKTKAIEEIDDNIRALAEKMIDIMIDYEGIGLAGPQAGVDLQIFVISLTGEKEDAKVFINPKVEGFGKTVPGQEGCLSFPGIFTTIRRPGKTKVTALDLDGNEFSEEAEGLYARCIQHEYDHLQGVTIADRMGRIGQIKFRGVLEDLRNRYEQNS